MKAGGFFSSAVDLMQKTPLFWENYVQKKIKGEFLGLYRFLNDPYPDAPTSTSTALNPTSRGCAGNWPREDVRDVLACRVSTS